VNALLSDMASEAAAVVAEGSFGAPTSERRVAYMRYVGQGHEIPVPLPGRRLTQADVAAIRADYDREYSRYYDRPVPGSDVEIMSYAVLVATVPGELADPPIAAGDPHAKPARIQKVRDTVTGEVADWEVYDRATLGPGAKLRGPAIVAEDETSTMVGPGWSASINALGYIELLRGEN
jgi:N-methylhydantoinase A